MQRRGRAAATAVAVLVGAAAAASCALPPDSLLPSVKSHVVTNSVDAEGRGTLVVNGCTLLDSRSVFTQRIDSLPRTEFTPSLDPIARAGSMLAAVGRERLGTGSSTRVFQNHVAGFPLNTVNGTARTLLVGTPDTGIESVEVLFPTATEGVNWQDEPNTLFGDRHLMVLDRSTCRLQEHISYNNTFGTSESAVEWTTPVVSSSRGLRVDPVTGEPLPARVDGAYLPITPLVYRFDEIFPEGLGGPVGEIHHALRIALPQNVNAAGSFVAHAAHADGTSTDPAAIPMGTRLRLSRAALDRLTPTLSPGAAAVLTALHRYGAVVADSTLATTAPTPGGFTLSGEFNPAWPSAVLSDIGRVRMSDFEVVDVSCWVGETRLAVPSPLPSQCGTTPPSE